MSEKISDQNTENENILGPGIEPLAVCLMLLFLWILFVSLTSKYIM